MIVFTRGGVRVGEAWFHLESPEAGVDIVRYHQLPDRPVSGSVSEFPTIVVDLSRSAEDLFADMRKNTRYEIRRAEEKDNLGFRSIEPGDTKSIPDFVAFYNSFASQKGLRALDAVNEDKLTRYAEAGMLRLSMIGDGSGNDLVWHAYCAHHGRARLLHSASHFRAAAEVEDRSLLGRANRLHHWRDMVDLKTKGFSLYDFGGWYDGDEDPDKLRINAFKEQFGGEVRREFDCELPVTLKGHVLLSALRVKEGMSKLRGRLVASG